MSVFSSQRLHDTPRRHNHGKEESAVVVAAVADTELHASLTTTVKEVFKLCGGQPGSFQANDRRRGDFFSNEIFDDDGEIDDDLTHVLNEVFEDGASDTGHRN